MATTTKELSVQLEEVTKRLRALESGQNVMTSSPGLPLEKWNDHGFVHRHEIKPIVRALNNGGGGSAELEERVEVLESGQTVLTSSMRAVEANQLILTSVVNRKQDELTAGSGIEITDNVISATGGGGTSLSDSLLDLIQNPSTISITSGGEINAVKLKDTTGYNIYGFAMAHSFTPAVATERTYSTHILLPDLSVASDTVVNCIVLGGFFTNADGSVSRLIPFPYQGTYDPANYYGLALIRGASGGIPLIWIEEYISNTHSDPIVSHVYGLFKVLK